ncbi:MAG: hypothetical protein ABIO39_04275 [Caulobacteraceae bacterium]
MPRTTDAGLIAAVLATLAFAPHALAEEAGPKDAAAEPMAEVGGWPKISFDTVGNLEYAGLGADRGKGRGPDVKLRFDSTLLVEFNDALSLDALFQFKPREPLSPSDPNRDLFINQGAGRKEGGKMKELYIRYGDYRVGKFVQDFGRAYALAPGPFAADMIEEPEEGYEPADMIGVERIHVFGDESTGWRQISLSAFMVDRTFLHESFPFNEGLIHYKDGGVGNTRWPENLMATYDVLNMPVGHWAHMSYQASVIRWGRTYGAERGEWWTTAGADISIPVAGSVADTLRGTYTQLRFYLELARRDNFEGVAGRARSYLTASAEYMRGPWVFDLTTTQRWTHDRVDPSRKDALYTATLAYTLPSATVAALSVAREQVGDRRGVYAGLRLTQAFTLCSRCLAKGRFF